MRARKLRRPLQRMPMHLAIAASRMKADTFVRDGVGWQSEALSIIEWRRHQPVENEDATGPVLFER